MGSHILMVICALLATLNVVNSSEVIKRTGPIRLPSCVDYTPFTYSGCFADGGSPRTLLYKSDVEFKTMTVEKCVAFCKGNGYRHAGLEYYGECWCGASVNAIQIDESNCRLPCTGNATEACGGNKAISIYQDPTFKIVDWTTINNYMAIGCYSEGPNGRSLGWKQGTIEGSSLTVETCLSTCKMGGYAFAGVEFGRECYCGVVLGNGTIPLAATECDMRCTGNKDQLCGGRSKLNIYVDRDLESTEPCGYMPLVSSSSTISQSSTSTLDSTSTTIVTSSSSVTLTSQSSTTPQTPTTSPPSTTSQTSTTSTTSVASSTTSSPISSTLQTSSFESSSSSGVLPTPLTTSDQTSSSSGELPTSFTTPAQSSSTSTSLSASDSSTSRTFSPSSGTTTSSISSGVLPTPITTTTTSTSTSTSSSSSITNRSTLTLTSSFSTTFTSLTLPPPTSTSSNPTTTTSQNICTTLYTIYPPLPTPVCEYRLGRWCARPIPEFSDTFTCLKSFTACVTQLGACFRDAGYPDSLRCNEFNQYCSRIASFCGTFCPGPKCSIIGCRQVVPAYGVPSIPTILPGTVYTSKFPCLQPSQSSSTLFATIVTPKPYQPTTTNPPIPTYPSICTQPSNQMGDYGPFNPVGGYPLPSLSCNNDWSSYNSGFPFKLYTSPDTKSCRSYPRSGNSGPVQGCIDACNEQYRLCAQGYADPFQSSNKFKREERNVYENAINRCAYQRDDCYFINRAVVGGTRCSNFDSGY